MNTSFDSIPNVAFAGVSQVAGIDFQVSFLRVIASVAVDPITGFLARYGDRREQRQE